MLPTYEPPNCQIKSEQETGIWGGKLRNVEAGTNACYLPSNLHLLNPGKRKKGQNTRGANKTGHNQVKRVNKQIHV